MIVSPDVGGVLRARNLASRLNCDLAIIDKRRERAGVSEVMNIIGEVAGCDCILVDDICDSGGTLWQRRHRADGGRRALRRRVRDARGAVGRGGGADFRLPDRDDDHHRQHRADAGGAGGGQPAHLHHRAAAGRGRCAGSTRRAASARCSIEGKWRETVLLARHVRAGHPCAAGRDRPALRDGAGQRARGHAVPAAVRGGERQVQGAGLAARRRQRAEPSTAPSPPGWRAPTRRRG